MNETKSALPTAEALRALFAGCADYTERLIRCGLEERLLLPVCWLDGVVAGDALGLEILRPLTELLRTGRLRSQEEALERCLAGLIYRCSAERIPDLDAAAEALCRGSCLVLFEELGCALSFEARSAQRRAVAEPSLEKSLKGGKDSFTETLRVNTALVRQRLNTRCGSWPGGWTGSMWTRCSPWAPWRAAWPTAPPLPFPSCCTPSGLTALPCTWIRAGWASWQTGCR